MLSSRAPALILISAGLLIGLAAGLLLFYGLPASQPTDGAGTAGGGSSRSTAAPAPVVGAPAPDFTLKNIEGRDVSLSGLKGQVVLVNFWATWCGPCRIEMPLLDSRYQAFKDQGFVVLAVNLDEPLPDVKAYAQNLNLTFPVLLDPGAKVNNLYRVRGYPTSYVVDRDGVISQLHIGLVTESQLDNYLLAVGLGG